MCCKITQIIQNNNIPCPNSVYPVNGNGRIVLPRKPCDQALEMVVTVQRNAF